MGANACCGEKIEPVHFAVALEKRCGDRSKEPLSFKGAEIPASCRKPLIVRLNARTSFPTILLRATRFAGLQPAAPQSGKLTGVHLPGIFD
jgi:hypothetical protein